MDHAANHLQASFSNSHFYHHIFEFLVSSDEDRAELPTDAIESGPYEMMNHGLIERNGRDKSGLDLAMNHGLIKRNGRDKSGPYEMMNHGLIERNGRDKLGPYEMMNQEKWFFIAQRTR